jgi:lysophospholipase L1-like esterase
MGEHTLDARAFVPAEGSPQLVARTISTPVGSTHLERIARGDVIAALGDSTTEGEGDGPWGPGTYNHLPAFGDWGAAFNAAVAAGVPWVTGDGRNYPQPDHVFRWRSRPSFTVKLASALAAERGHPVLILNEGWSGATADGFTHVARSGYLQNVFAVARPNVWLLHLGANDALVHRPAGEFGDRMQSVVSSLQGLYGAAPGDIHVACPIYAKQDSRHDLEKEYLPVIDALRTGNHLGAGPDFFAYFRDHQDGLADGVHPNGAGYNALAVLWNIALDGQNTRCAG